MLQRNVVVDCFWASLAATAQAISSRFEHVRIEDGALHVFLPRGKEDQLGRGRTTRSSRVDRVAVSRARFERWLDLAAQRAGPLFRVITGEQIRSMRIHPRAVTRAVQRATQRAGLATSSDAHGHSLRAIQQHVGWRDARTPTRYIDPSRGAARSVAVGLL